MSISLAASSGQAAASSSAAAADPTSSSDHQQADDIDPLTSYLIESSFGKLFFSVFHTTDAAPACLPGAPSIDPMTMMPHDEALAAQSAVIEPDQEQVRENADKLASDQWQRQKPLEHESFRHNEQNEHSDRTEQMHDLAKTYSNSTANASMNTGDKTTEQTSAVDAEGRPSAIENGKSVVFGKGAADPNIQHVSLHSLSSDGNRIQEIADDKGAEEQSINPNEELKVMSFDKLATESAKLDFWNNLKAKAEDGKKGRRGRRRKRDVGALNETEATGSGRTEQKIDPMTSTVMEATGNQMVIASSAASATSSPQELSSLFGDTALPESQAVPQKRGRGRPRKYPIGSDRRKIRAQEASKRSTSLNTESRTELLHGHDALADQLLLSDPHQGNVLGSSDLDTPQGVKQRALSHVHESKSERNRDKELLAQYERQQQELRRQQLGLPRRRGRPPKMRSTFDHAAYAAKRRELAMLHDSPASENRFLGESERASIVGTASTMSGRGSSLNRPVTQKLVQLQKLKKRPWIEDSLTFKPWPRRYIQIPIQLHSHSIDLDRLWRAHYLRSRSDPLSLPTARQNKAAPVLLRNLRRTSGFSAQNWTPSI